MAQLAYLVDADPDRVDGLGTGAAAVSSVGRSLSLFGSDAARLGRIADDARLAGFGVHAMRKLSDVTEGNAGLLGDIVAIDVPFVSAAEMAALVRLDERAARSGAQLIVLTSEAALEDVFGCLERSHPQIVIGGRQSEGLIALGAALARLQGRRVREMDEEDRLAFLKLTEQLGRLSDRLDRFESGTARLESPAPGFRGEGGDTRRRARPALPDARLIHRIIHQRRLRGKFLLPDLFADPAWDILLDLTAARVEHRRVSVTSLCIAAGVPPTTALRWIGQMIDLGLLVREQDDQDRRRAFIDLSEDGAAAMARYFAALEGEGGQLS